MPSAEKSAAVPDDSSEHYMTTIIQHGVVQNASQISVSLNEISINGKLYSLDKTIDVISFNYRKILTLWRMI